MLRIFATGLVFLFVAVPAAFAQSLSVDELAKQVEAQHKSAVEAVDFLRQAMVAVSGHGKFAFRKALFIEEPPQGFGVYTPRKNNVFKLGEKIYVYLEPVGLTWKMQDGFYHMAATVDYEVRTPEGKVILGQHNATKVELKSREQNQEVMFRFSLSVSGARPGKLILAATYHDVASKKAATFELPFAFE